MSWFDLPQPALDAALTTCRNLDLFNKWPQDRTQSMSVVALAKASGADEDVLRKNIHEHCTRWY